MTRCCVVALLSLAALAQSASAASYVMTSDETLVEQADLIVEGRIVGSTESSVGERPSTTWWVEIERVVAGWSASSTIPVRVVGSPPSRQGMTIDLHGVPRFVEGERVLLFLVRQEDGQWGILHLLLGAFHRVELDGDAFAMRFLGDAQILAGNAKSAEEQGLLRSWPGFVDWIGGRADGEIASGQYFTRAPAVLLGAPPDKYTVLTYTNTAIRWFLFDTGGRVDWRSLAGGQPGLAGGGGAELQRALGAWDAAVSQVSLRYVGTTGAAAGFAAPDGINSLVFDDPDGDMPGRFSCLNGGTLAIGGPWFDTDGTRLWKGRPFYEAGEADIITNDGLTCFWSLSPNASEAAEELFGHEVGHTLGLGHSCGDGSSGSCAASVLDDALMRAFIHDDGRGATLNADDKAGIQYLYKPAGGGGGGGGISVTAPSDLTAQATSESVVLLGWLDRSSNETGFQLERSLAGSGAFSPIALLPAGSTLYADSGLAASTAYTWRVRAVAGTALSGYSNEVTATTLEVAPAAPVDVATMVLPDGRIQLSWRDVATNESGYRIESRRVAVRPGPADAFAYVGDGWQTLALESAGSQGLLVPAFAAGELHNLRVVAFNAVGESAAAEVAVTSPHSGATTCSGDASTLCLFGGRFVTRVLWRKPNGDTGAGLGAPLGDRSGTFTFFNPANVELVIKMIDASTINLSFWHFFGALSDVEYWISVTDATDRTTRTYHNPQGEYCGRADVGAFVSAAGPGETTLAATTLAPRVEAAAARGSVGIGEISKAGSPCVEDATTLCLFGGRFAVTVDFVGNPADGLEAPAHRVSAGDTSGYFWFFNDQNIELVVKVLDGRALSGAFWVFYGALSNLPYTVRVYDTVTDTEARYDNPFGTYCGVADITALPSP